MSDSTAHQINFINGLLSQKKLSTVTIDEHHLKFLSIKRTGVTPGTLVFIWLPSLSKIQASEIIEELQQ